MTTITKNKRKSDILYVLSCNDLIKIGITNNIDKRVKTLQTGNPHPIIVEYVESRYKPHKAEQYLHRAFHKNRISGEWFKDITVHQIRSKLMMFLDQEPEPNGF